MQSTPRNSGQALVEFTIFFPLILLFTLALIQGALIYNAYEVVNYAAYCSARAGIVHNADMDKMETAAVIATISLADRKLASTISNLEFHKLPDIADYYRTFSAKTRVQLEEYQNNEITVTVTYMFRLIVPGAQQLLLPVTKLSDKALYNTAKESAEEFGAPYLPVSATCTLTL